MRWLRGISTIGLAMVLASCGSSGFDGPNGTDQQVLTFLGFSGGEIQQADFVGSTSSDVDVCQGLCTSGSTGGDVMAEIFTSTRAFATFLNNGKSDILIDRYTVAYPGTGVPDRTVTVNQRITGGRCPNGRSCATNLECGALGGCTHETSGFEILLVPIPAKELLRSGDCPDLLTLTPGTIIPETLPIEVRFSGSDATGERFNVSVGYEGVFGNFDNCDSSGA